MMDEKPQNVPRVQAKSKKRLGIWLLLPIGAAFIVLASLSWQWKDSLKLQKVTVEGSFILPSKQVVALASVPSKAGLFGVDLMGVRSRLLKQPFIRSANINRQYPGTIVLTIAEREPIASLSGGQIRYIDAAGMVLPYVNSPVAMDLPVISGLEGIQSVQAGKVIENEALSSAIEILQTAQRIDSSMYHFISEIAMNRDRDVVLYSNDVGVPIYMGQGDVVRKLVMLQTFWNTFVKTNDPERLRDIDLRFSDQVVVKWNQPAEARGAKASL